MHVFLFFSGFRILWENLWTTDLYISVMRQWTAKSVWGAFPWMLWNFPWFSFFFYIKICYQLKQGSMFNTADLSHLSPMERGWEDIKNVQHTARLKKFCSFFMAFSAKYVNCTSLHFCSGMYRERRSCGSERLCADDVPLSSITLNKRGQAVTRCCWVTLHINYMIFSETLQLPPVAWLAAIITKTSTSSSPLVRLHHLPVASRLWQSSVQCACMRTRTRTCLCVCVPAPALARVLSAKACGSCTDWASHQVSCSNTNIFVQRPAPVHL